LSGTIVLTQGLIQITGPLAIVGPGAGILTIDGNAQNRIFNKPVVSRVPDIDGPDYLVSISGLRLTNGAQRVEQFRRAIYTERSLRSIQWSSTTTSPRAAGASISARSILDKR
jgi:hypothetical protein